MSANSQHGADRSRPISQRVIGCAMDVSNSLRPGYLESVYESALCLELNAQGIAFERQKPLTVHYKGQIVGTFVADLIVESKLLIEIKAVRKLNVDHEAQLINYLHATRVPVGLLLNFGSPRLEIRRLVWQYDETQRI
jgi:GxxExxY protein